MIQAACGTVWGQMKQAYRFLYSINLWLQWEMGAVLGLCPLV